MTRKNPFGIAISATLLAAASFGWTCVARAQIAQQPRPSLREPVYRVSRARTSTPERPQTHPLDPALELAENALRRFRSQVRDYTATVVKRERINDKVGDYEYMFTKVRARRFENGRAASPRCVYMYFLKPMSIKGREVIWIEGQNDNKLIAHEGGVKGKFLPTIWLPPDGMLAMRNQRYPISEIGIENMLVRLIERGTHEKQFGDVEVHFLKNAKINGRSCTVLDVTHPVKRDYFEFFKGQIFIDDELQLPIRYAAYLWPERPGGAPPLIEEYTYLNLKLNVGLQDSDFDPENRDYNF